MMLRPQASPRELGESVLCRHGTDIDNLTHVPDIALHCMPVPGSSGTSSHVEEYLLLDFPTTSSNPPSVSSSTIISTATIVNDM